MSRKIKKKRKQITFFFIAFNSVMFYHDIEITKGKKMNLIELLLKVIFFVSICLMIIIYLDEINDSIEDLHQDLVDIKAIEILKYKAIFMDK